MRSPDVWIEPIEHRDINTYKKVNLGGQIKENGIHIGYD